MELDHYKDVPDFNSDGVRREHSALKALLRESEPSMRFSDI